MTMEEVEAALSAAYDANKADTGLYNAGLKMVVFDVVDGRKTFAWFDHAKDLSDTLNV
ncbi:hypothetical protein [Paraburkholderia sp. SIMBA_054]|uniref:hypothetical protein n=1 Tax=Paraburkholderia sp. SIMBA_054 TaxID=3085795 RepID=UPI00397AAF94